MAMAKKFAFQIGDRVRLKNAEQVYIIHSIIDDPTDGRDGMYEQYRLSIPQLDGLEGWRRLVYRSQIELCFGQLELLEVANA